MHFGIKFLAILLVVQAGLFLANPGAARAETGERKVKSKVFPVYPEIAKRMSIAGTVKVEVVVAPNGTVKSTKVMGGHPVLVDCAVEAAKKWRFEAGPEETTQIVEFKFLPLADH